MNQKINQQTKQTKRKTIVPSNGLMKCLMWNCIQVVIAINLRNADNEKKKERICVNFEYGFFVRSFVCFGTGTSD